MKSLLIVFVVLFSAQLSSAAAFRATCTWNSRSGGKLEGSNVDQRLEIASVSKVMTSYWAVRKMGVKGRFTTTLHVRKVDSRHFDIHIAGGHDPFSGREALQFFAGQLNDLGVEKIRRLTFDEKFKFFDDVRAAEAAQGHFGLLEPDANRVAKELQSAFDTLDQGYESLIERARDQDLRLPSRIQLEVDDISFLSSGDFKPRSRDLHLSSRSAPILAILKEMNRTSNNHAANQIFEHLGGASAFRAFIEADLGLTEQELRMVNGSGDRLDLPQGKAAYNESTCRAQIRVLQALQAVLEKHRKGLQDVLSVAGADAIGESSKLSDLYSNIVTSSSLIAKTGTVNPAVTLAGVLSTPQGLVYFGLNCGTQGTAADWAAGQGLIRETVSDLFQKFGGSRPLFYEPAVFIPFDKESAFQKAP